MRTDCVFSIRKGFAPLSWILRIFQKGKSHCAVVHYLPTKKIVSEFVGSGFRVILFEEWLKHNKVISVYRIDIADSDVYQSIDDVKNDLIEDHNVKSGQKYAHFELFYAGVEVVLGWIGIPELKISTNGANAQICSEWVARFYDKFGKWKGDKFFDVVTITECEEEIKKVGLKYD